MVGAAITRECYPVFVLIPVIVAFAMPLLLASMWIGAMAALFGITEHARNVAAALNRLAETSRIPCQV